MTKNIGNADQTVPLVGGLSLLSVVLIGTGGWRWLGLIGLLPLLTAIVRVCPLYTVLGIDTYAKERNHV
jgi:hypothetical protein